MANDTSNEESDESLALRMAVDKDRAACSILVERYAPKVTGYLTTHYRQSLGEHGIEDAVQTVFTRVMKYIASFDSKTGPFEAWIIRIASNVAIDMLSEKDELTYESFTEDPVYYPPPDDCDDEVPEEDVKDWQVRALDDFIEKKLKGLEQELARRDLETDGQTDVAQLAEEFGTNKDTIYTTRSKVKKKFIEELKTVEKQRIRVKGKT